MSEERNTSQWLSALAQVAQVLAIPAIYAYFVGYLFAYYYFKEFGLAPRSVGIDTHTYLIYSFTVFRLDWWLWVALILIMVVLASARQTWLRWLGAFALLVMFLPAHSSAVKVGQFRAAELRNGLIGNRIQLAFRGDSLSEYPQAFLDANEERKLILLARTDTGVFVVRQGYPDPPLPELPRGAVFWVPWTDLRLTQTTIASTVNLREGRPQK